MDMFAHIPIQLILFFILYGVTGVVPLLAALYLLLYRANAIAPDVTPPMRLRRWAAAFFASMALGHVWWLLYYACLRDLRFLSAEVLSAGYVAVVVLDFVALFTTLSGTLLAMLQDRRRRVWPVFAAMLPFVALGGVLMFYPSRTIFIISIAYVLLLYVLFTVYMVFAVRRYGRWLNDNYADLENKKVWLSQVVMIVCLLLIILYSLVGFNDLPLLFFIHFIELMLFCLLLWRVETLPQLDEAYQTRPQSLPTGMGLANLPDEKPEGITTAEGMDGMEEKHISPLPSQTEAAGGSAINIDIDQIERLLDERCKATQLYLTPDITLQQLAQTVGTNRSYLSQYFSCRGITYNIYINSLRVNHFISRYQELTAAGQPVVAQQLAQESGFRSYSTFARAFTLHTGQTVKVWMHSFGG